MFDWLTRCFVKKNINPDMQSRLLFLALTGFAFTAYFYIRQVLPSLDLMAMWLAGKFQAAGDLSQVYPPDMGIFTMYPPDLWAGYLRAEHGFDVAVYPFLYPPIWAWISGYLPADLAFYYIAQMALMLNSMLLAASMFLVLRVTNCRMNPIIYVGLSGAILLFTPIGSVALAQGQLQILVSFLILLALERSRFDAPVAAGIALALAASLKLYPALFALFWLATGERRAFLSFVIFGAILAGLSIFLTGWPLHADFLHQISTITNTVLITGVTVNIDAVVGLIFFTDQMTIVPSLDTYGLQSPPSGWFVMHRPLIWKMLSNVGLLAVLAGLWWLFRSLPVRLRYTVLWPVALTLVALMAPIAWTYYYIPTVLFAVTLPGLLGYRKGLALLALGAVPMLTKIIPLYLSLHWLVWMFPVVSVMGLLIWCVGFGLGARQKL